MTARTLRYVIALTAAAVGAFVVLVLVVPGRWPTALEIAVLVGGIALAERTEVAFEWDRTSGGFTLADVAIVAGLLLLPAPLVVAAVGPGVALAHARPGWSPIKIVYNVAIATLGAALAGLTLHLLPVVPPLVAGRSVPAAIVGMLVYGGAAALGFAGLLARLQGRETARSMRSQLPMLAASTLGSTAVGVVLAGLWDLQPSLVPFVLAPAAAVHLAQRASIRAATSLAKQRTDHARLVRVVDGASDGIILLDAEGLVQIWNPAMTRLTGRPASRAVGRPVARVLGGDVRDGDPVVGRWTLVHARVQAPVLEQEAVLVDPDGTRRDVSRQRELERLRSDFVARVSHELRTPLTPIRGFASVLLRRWDLLDHDQRTEALTRIVERADDLHSLVEDLLLVTRIEQRDVAGLVHPGPTDLATLTRDAVQELLEHHPDRTVTVAVADDLPLAHADEDRVRQILDAVLDNATRYTDPETPIEVDVDRDGDDVRVRIADHGPGIPPAEREAIFERFHRLEDPLTMQTSGVGVGLFLGRRLATAMHGSLELVPTPPGEGAVFALRLPVLLPAAIDTDEIPIEGVRPNAGDRTSAGDPASSGDRASEPTPSREGPSSSSVTST